MRMIHRCDELQIFLEGNILSVTENIPLTPNGSVRRGIVKTYHHAFDIHNEDDCVTAVTMSRHCLEAIQNQTDKICKAAISADTDALSLIRKHTEELVRYSVKLDGKSIRHSKIDVSIETHKVAIEANAMAFRFINKPSRDLILWYATHYTNAAANLTPPMMTTEVMEASIRCNPDNLRYFVVCRGQARHRTGGSLRANDKLSKLAVDLSKGMAIKYLYNPSDELIEHALKLDEENIAYVHKKVRHETAMRIVKKNGLLLKYLTSPSSLVVLEAVKQNPDAIIFAKSNLNEDLISIAVDCVTTDEAAKYIHLNTKENRNKIYLKMKFPNVDSYLNDDDLRGW